jgi:hypothetical protein
MRNAFCILAFTLLAGTLSGCVRMTSTQDMQCGFYGNCPPASDPLCEFYKNCG